MQKIAGKYYTKGYGRKNKTILRYVYPKGRWDLDVLLANETIFIGGLNEINKNNSFYRLKVDSPNNPIPLSRRTLIFVYFCNHVRYSRNFILKAKRKYLCGKAHARL